MAQMNFNSRKISEIKLSEEFPLGMEFLTISEFDEMFSISALNKGIPFIVKNRNKKSITLGCKEPGCSFRVISRYVISTSKCVIKHMHSFHVCNQAI